jgi:Na+/H+ antiporter NhaD/arsenite permease-like protein
MSIEIILLVIFIVGYICITLEHAIKFDKLIPALLMMSLAWTFISLNLDNISTWFNSDSMSMVSIANLNITSKSELLHGTLLHHFSKTAEILVFLIGAMAIVEMIDHFNGFESIKNIIKTKRKKILLWIICSLAFFLSAIIDNLTATIVLITILRKLIPDVKDRMWFSGLIIIAANAGGAWTPIGDITTTMLWIAGKVTTPKLVLYLGLPSLVSMLVPVTIASFFKVFQGEISVSENSETKNSFSILMLYLGLFLIICVPIFKTITHLPPYLGMMLSFSIFAIVSEMINLRLKENQSTTNGPTIKALSKIEIPSVLFFLGILMTVAAMESLGMIYNFGNTVSNSMSRELFVSMLGISSSIIDNVPLVAASIGMFPNECDSIIWHYIAFAAGTGGSILIIGSAAGVVAMGMEKITFGWYLKNISLLALIGYLSGLGLLFLFL